MNDISFLMNFRASLRKFEKKKKSVFILHFIIYGIFHGSKSLLRPTLNVISMERIVLEKKLLLFVQFSFMHKDQSLINPS